jgi:hypothetical protein
MNDKGLNLRDLAFGDFEPEHEQDTGTLFLEEGLNTDLACLGIGYVRAIIAGVINRAPGTLSNREGFPFSVNRTDGERGKPRGLWCTSAEMYRSA